jgi:hypothetical protein
MLVVAAVLVAVLQRALVVLVVQAAVARGITTTNPAQAHLLTVRPIPAVVAAEEVVTAEERPKGLEELVAQVLSSSNTHRHSQSLIQAVD